jgi:hypothetical protein
MKIFNISIIFIFIVFPLYSQVSHSINDFGTYIITESGFQKVPIIGDESQLFLIGFRGQYAVFGASNAYGRINSYVLYDIEKNIVSEHLKYGYSENFNILSIGISIDLDNILFKLGNIIYLLDSQNLSLIDNCNINNYNFVDLIEINESSIFQYEMTSYNSIRYFFGGDYKYFEWSELFFNPVLIGIPFNLTNSNLRPFAKKYLYLDITYNEILWEVANHNIFDIETHISFQPELNGERAVISVYSYVLLGR